MIKFFILASCEISCIIYRYEILVARDGQLMPLLLVNHSETGINADILLRRVGSASRGDVFLRLFERVRLPWLVSFGSSCRKMHDKVFLSMKFRVQRLPESPLDRNVDFILNPLLKANRRMKLVVSVKK